MNLFFYSYIRCTCYFNPSHQNGFTYTNDNIDQLLFRRHIGKAVRKRGGKTKGPSKRTREQDEAFERNLRALIEKLNDVS